ncbi:acyl-homoserine-lactone synthase [Seohaeicola zhoushanensis]|uniref:acyl-homoserine-lactone synthase n=1 Tax=Seohaeicola zhoushanensis TaxID=1569283 RepID=A0A8J3GY77_9RHOB|nr:acyl-homoserine-lactone synthase [Seohaeicola zhoushanensis]GHF56892.1 N-acyl-L-homoserine lactone synthetase [Seohaeicola zhoushanensis]
MSDRRPHLKELGGARASVLSFTNMHTYGDLLVRYLKARKDVFIDRLHWELPNVDGMEFDQYDTPLCRWVIIHEFGEILAGIRLVPTTAKCGTYTYMLRDAQHGLLSDIPSDVLFFPAPVEDQIWEASRLFITEHVTAQRRAVVQFLLMQHMILTATGEGARHVIGIVPAVWSRWLRRLGLYAVPVGPRFEIEGTSSQAALFNVSDQLTWAQPEVQLPV